MNLAYVAGIVDGEGCIGFQRVRKSIYPRVSVINTNLELVQDLQRAFGGILCAHKRPAHWKVSWTWSLGWTKAVDFLDRIQPWLRIKDQQAATVFAWDAIRLGRGRSTAAEYAEHAETVEFLVERMHWLNKRGEGAFGIDPAVREAAIIKRG